MAVCANAILPIKKKMPKTTRGIDIRLNVI